MKNKYKNEESNRKSGVEIFRVFCMLLVIQSHLFLSFFPREKSQNVLFWIIFSCFFVSLTGLNNPGFMCISGYYGIKRNSKKLFHFLCMIWLYSVCDVIVNRLLLHSETNLEYIFKSCFPISTGKYWYATAYFLLALLSPAFNLISNKTDKKQHFDIAFFSLFLFILIPSFIYWGPNSEYSVNFVVMMCYYVVLQFIKKYEYLDRIKKQTLYFGTIISFLLMVGLNMVTTFLAGAGMPFGYFMPFQRSCCIIMMVFSVGMFEIFKRLNVKVQFIRNISGFVFAVYFLESTIEKIISNYVNLTEISENSYIKFIIMILYSMIVFVIGVLIEFIRKKVFYNIETKVFNEIKKILSRLLKFREDNVEEGKIIT